MKALFFIMLVSLSGCSGCQRDTKPSIVNTQVKIKYDGKVHFSFGNLEDGLLAQSGDLKVLESELKNDSYLLDLQQKLNSIKGDSDKEGNYLVFAIEEDIYRRKLSLIDKIIKEKALIKESKNLEISVEEYIEKYIYTKIDKEVSSEEIEEYLSSKVKPEGIDVNNWAKYQILKGQEKKSIDYVLEKYILELPIVVGIKPKKFDVEINGDWSPFWGPLNASHKVIIFSATKSHADLKLLSNISSLKDKYENLLVSYRPLFSGSDPNELMKSYMYLCLWVNEKDSFWSYFEKSLGDFKDKTEQKLFQVLKDLNINDEKVKKCFFSQEYKEAIEYHQKYNQFLGIESGPVVFVNGEVLHGVVSVEDIDSVLMRQLSVPNAGHWK